MTHWFHRNPLKATAPVSFNYYEIVTGPAASKICRYVATAKVLTEPRLATRYLFRSLGQHRSM